MKILLTIILHIMTINQSDKHVIYNIYYFIYLIQLYNIEHVIVPRLHTIYVLLKL